MTADADGIRDIDLEDENVVLLTFDREQLPVIEAVRAESRRTRNLIRRLIQKVTDQQQHLDDDVTQLTSLFQQLESEVSGVKAQAATQGASIDFTGLDNLVSAVQAAVPTTSSTAGGATGPAGPTTTDQAPSQASTPTAPTTVSDGNPPAPIDPATGAAATGPSSNVSAAGAAADVPAPADGAAELWLPTSVPAATSGTAYSTTLSTAGGSGTYTWTVGGLPPGLAVSGNVISGIPTSPGSYTLDLTVVDAETGATATGQVTLSVS